MQLLTNRYCSSKRWHYWMVKKERKEKRKKELELPATPTQTSWGEGEVGFTQCRLGYMEERSHSVWCTLPVSRCPAPRLKSVMLTHPSTRLDMYYSTHAPAGWQIWLSWGPPQSLVVYMTPSNYVMSLIMPKYYWNFRECLRQARGWSLPVSYTHLTLPTTTYV